MNANECIERQTEVLKTFDRARFGRRSEKLAAASVDDEQHAFVFEEIETGIAAIRAKVTSGTNKDGKRPPRPRKGFATHLERIEVVIEPEDLPEHAGKTKILIGEDISERLGVVAAMFRLIVTRRPKCAFKNEDGVIQAPAPTHIIEAGIPTEALLTQIAVSKYAGGIPLPLHRQEAIYARDKVELDRRLMAQWMGKLGFKLDILADYILNEITKAERILADETNLPTLAPGSGSAKTAWPWAYARDDRTFGGNKPAHGGLSLRRQSGDRLRGTAPQRLSRDSAGSRGRGLQQTPPQGRRQRRRYLAGCWRVAARQERSAAMVRDLFTLSQTTLPRVSGKSELAGALRYSIKRRDVFERFLMDGSVEIDSNIVERAIRPQAITRKNSLFAGSDGGGKTWATIATQQTAKMNSVDPQAWLTQTLERMANGRPSSEIHTLAPWSCNV
ncbi:Transposase [Rhizobium sp. NFACC06-2]|nr:Transposase [Rhizobium sp. NFACC06-2]